MLKKRLLKTLSVVTALLFVAIACLGCTMTTHKVTNPLANDDQYYIETTAMRLLLRDDVQQAKNKARALLLADPLAATQAGLDTLEQVLDEDTQSLLYDVILRDTNQARIGLTANAAHEWFGHRANGARYGIDNPDTIYRYSVLDPNGSYRLTATPGEGELPSQFSFLMYENFRAGAVVPGQPQDPPSHGPKSENDAFSIGLFDEDIETMPDGSFVLTLSPDGNKERTNHIQINPFSTTLFMRQAIPDWQNQSPFWLNLERLDEHNTQVQNDGLLAEAFIARIQSHTQFWAKASHYYMYQTPANSLPTPFSRGGEWGYATVGNFHLAHDEALIISINLKGAAYTGFILADPWMLSPNHINQSGSLNNTQTHVNEDGSATYVIAATDPGIQNWLNPDGLMDGGLMIRWQAFEDHPVTGDELLKSVEYVKSADLEKLLPKTIPRITNPQRKALLKAREEAFNRRLAY